jgi:hypothetical protein
LFFSTFKPTAFIVDNVAPSSYLCQAADRGHWRARCENVLDGKTG